MSEAVDVSSRVTFYVLHHLFVVVVGVVPVSRTSFAACIVWVVGGMWACLRLWTCLLIA